MMSAKNLPEATLCILVRDNPIEQVLLGYKKIGFGQGKVTGFGGKIEPGESAQGAAIREMQEETGVCISPDDLEYVGRLAFIFPHKPAWSQLVHLFRARMWSGSPSESEEMAPAWFDITALPFEQMWQDGRHWLPPVLAGEKIVARFVFEADNETVEEIEIRFVDSIEGC